MELVSRLSFASHTDLWFDDLSVCCSAKAMFVDHYSTVPPELLALRSVVLEKKKVRTHIAA